MKPLTLGITIGDPLGIGPWVTIKALANLFQVNSNFKSSLRFIVIGDGKTLQNVIANLNLKLNLVYLPPLPWKKLPPLHECEVGIYDHSPYKEINLEEECGKAQLDYINTGFELLKDGFIDGIVTGPVNKYLISKVTDINFVGHTDYLKQYFGFKEDPVMLFLGSISKVVPVTTHVPLREVPKLLSVEKIVHTGKVAVRAIIDDFKCNDNFTIGIVGLNPHAGEGGLLGKEEKEIIQPAVEELKSWVKREGLNVEIRGVLSPERGFRELALKQIDMVIGMYHDQVLLPAKFMEGGKLVNFTAGVPIVRTSVDHGVGYDLIKSPHKIDEESMVLAIKIAGAIAFNRIRKQSHLSQ